MRLEKQCGTCESYFDNICTAHGGVFQYGEAVSEHKECKEWSPNPEYFSAITTNAPRYLRDMLNDSSIDFDQFIFITENYRSKVAINIFDAVKYIYGISIVDIAVLADVSFGVIYRAKTKGVPPKRMEALSSTLCISSNFFKSFTTWDFDKLIESRELFWNKPGIEQKLSDLPKWKLELIDIIREDLHIPQEIATEVARVDNLYWTTHMSLDSFTPSETTLIEFLKDSSTKCRPIAIIEYSLDIACKPHTHFSFLPPL